MKHKFLLSSIILYTLVLTHPDVILAQTGRMITLKEAIDLSIRNSKQLKGSRARIDEATANLRESEERRLPEAGISATHLRLNHPNIDIKAKTSDNSGGTGGTTTTQESPKPSSAT